MNKTWQEIAIQIEAIRKEKRIIQKELAEKCEMKQGGISRILSSKDVKYSTIKAICDALEVELKDLLY